MRTKTLLLTAAALLAVGIVSSQAQSPVYSQNVVGYATVSAPNSGTYYLMTCPFVIGVSNGLNEVFGTNTLPDASVVLTWNGVGYSTAVYATIDDEGIPGVQWYTDVSEGTALVPIPTIKPGQGFFLQPAGAVTTTFAGTVAVNLGGTTNMTLPNSGTYYLVGSTIPYAGYVTNLVALTNLPDASVVLTWNGVGYTSTVYASPDDEGINGVQWYTDVSEGTAAPCPFVNVGDGFFVQPAGSYTWSQTLPGN